MVIKSLARFLALLDKPSSDGLSGNACLTGLQLDLGYNQIGDAGVAKLAEALSSGNCPTGLHLDLSYNDINEARVAKLAAALGTGCCPTGLQLKLSNNTFCDEGAAKLVDALSRGCCPARLQLHLGYSGMSKMVHNQINKLLGVLEKKQAALSCVVFRQGLRSVDSPLKKLPDQVANAIFSFVLPATSPTASLLFKRQIKQAALPARLAPKTLLESGADSKENEASIKP